MAEDNRVSQRVILGALEQLACRADLVSNGVDAVEAAGRTRYDLILMDCQMPLMDGARSTSLIRAAEASRGGHVPIVALSASVLSGDRERWLAAGMDGVLTKPVGAVELRRLLLDTTKARVIAVAAGSAPTEASGVIPDRPSGLDVDGALARRFRGSMRIYAEVFALFLVTLREAVPKVYAALDTGALQALAPIAHELKGAALNVGADRLADDAARLEEAVGSVEPDMVLLRTLAISLERALDELGTFGTRLAAIGTAVEEGNRS